LNSNRAANDPLPRAARIRPGDECPAQRLRRTSARCKCPPCGRRRRRPTHLVERAAVALLALPRAVTRLKQNRSAATLAQRPPIRFARRQFTACQSPQSTDLTHKMLGSHFFQKRILDGPKRVDSYESCARVMGTAGGSKRWTQNTRFPMVSSGRTRPSTALTACVPLRVSRLKNPWKKCVVNLYLVFRTDAGH
jgi:hypothetical protein